MGTPELYIYAPQARWETVLLGDSLVQDVQSCSSAVEWDEHKSDTRTAVFKLQRCPVGYPGLRLLIFQGWEGS